jgi:hypothetical protein
MLVLHAASVNLRPNYVWTHRFKFTLIIHVALIDHHLTRVILHVSISKLVVVVIKHTTNPTQHLALILISLCVLVN